VRDPLRLAQSLTLLLSLLSFGHVHHGAHELHHIPGCVQDRMADGVGVVFDRTDLEVEFVLSFVIRLFTGLLYRLSLATWLWSSGCMRCCRFFQTDRPSSGSKPYMAIPFLGRCKASLPLPATPTPVCREPLRSPDKLSLRRNDSSTRSRSRLAACNASLVLWSSELFLEVVASTPERFRGAPLRDAQRSDKFADTTKMQGAVFRQASDPTNDRRRK